MPNQRRDAPPIGCNVPYCCSFNLLLLKSLEMALTLTTLILAAQFSGAATIIIIEIVTALACGTALFWTVLYILHLNARFPEFFPVLMFGYHLMMMLLCILSTICAAILWPQFKVPYYIVCTICSVVAAILFLMDTVLSFLWWRGSGDELLVCPCSPEKQDLV